MENSICSFEDIFKNLPKKKVNVISTCIFKLDNGYKDFSRYIDGAKNIKKVANKMGISFLVFLDDSIYNNKEIYDKLKETTYDKNTIFIKYSCPKFKRDETFHKGLFGTLVRFFPLFDFPNNPFKKVIISDIDYKESNDDDEFYTNYVLLKKFKVDGVCRTYGSLAYGEKFRNVEIAHKNKDNMSLLANCLVFGKKKFDHNYLINYLNEIMDHNSKLYKDMRKNTIRTEIDDTFSYGVDEYFLSHIMYYYFDKMKFNVFYIRRYGIRHVTDKLRDIYKECKDKNDNDSKTFIAEYRKFLQTVLHQPKNNNIDMLANIIYKILKSYDVQKIADTEKPILTVNINANQKQLNISNSIYAYLEQLNKNKNYKMIDKQSMEYVLQHKGIIRCYELYNKHQNKYIYIFNTYKLS